MSSSVDNKPTPRWSSLWNIPAAPDGTPLVVRKVNKGESTEAVGTHPFQALIWQPLEATGRYWARLFYGSQSAGGSATCCARLLRATTSELYPRTNYIPDGTDTGETVNLSGWEQSETASATVESNAGSGRTEAGGGWANYTSGAQTPVTRYSTTGGASVEYTVTGCTRIAWRFLTVSANAGQIGVTVTESSVDIPADQWQVGPSTGTRNISQQYTSSVLGNPSTKVGIAPIAANLDPEKTYVVTFTLTSGSRIYDSGLLCYDETNGYAYNTTGYTGIWDNYTSFGVNKYAACLYAGSRHVYQTVSCTRIDLSYAKRVNGGFCGVKIYDSNGNEISPSSYRNLNTHASGHLYFDQYAATSTESTITLADGLAAAVYYVHLWSLPDASNGFTETTAGSYLGSKWAIYVGVLSTYNTEIGGTVGVDTFINNVTQYTGGGSDPLDGAGNLVFAGTVRDSGDPVYSALPEVGYVTGVHGAETDPANLVVTMDGVTIDWAGASLNTEWTCDEMVVTFTTQVGTQANPTTYWADFTYTYKFNRFGVFTTVAIEATRSIYRGVWFFNQNIVPNSTATNGTKLGTGFTELYVEPGYSKVIASSVSGSNTTLNETQRGTCFFTPEGYAVAVKTLNPGEVWKDWTPGTNGTQIFERLRTAKTYAVAHLDPNSGNGVLLGSGETFEAKQCMRFFFDSRIPTLL